VDPRDARIAQLEKEVAELKAIVIALLKDKAELVDENTELRRRLGLNSQNSSKPPSSDPPGTERPKREPSGRKPGGQPGHKGHKRELLPVEAVDQLVPLKPKRCRRCHHGLAGADAEPLRHQVTELPVIAPVVTEYQLHALTCAHCGTRTRAELPEGVPASAFGPGVVSLVALLTGKFRLSHRLVQGLLDEVFGIDASLGSITPMERTASAALAQPVELLRDFVRKAPFVHMDETSWREARAYACLWVACTESAAVYTLASSRRQEVAKEILGDLFLGACVSDRYGAYSYLPNDRRQVCWSHLKRDFQGWAEGRGDGAALGGALVREGKKVFKLHRRYRAGEVSWEGMKIAAGRIRTQVRDLLLAAEVCPQREVVGMATEILRVEQALWTFSRVEGVEPSNNPAERALRPAVVWRKGSFGTHSKEGSRYVERVLSAVQTLKLQGRSAWAYLRRAISAALNNVPAPSLLPA
jgi:transposase